MFYFGSHPLPTPTKNFHFGLFDKITEPTENDFEKSKLFLINNVLSTDLR